MIFREIGAIAIALATTAAILTVIDWQALGGFATGVFVTLIAAAAADRS